MLPPAFRMRSIVLLAALLHVACLPDDEAAVAADVKYIKCDTCRQLVAAVHEQVAAERKKSKAKKLSEDSIQTIIESACKPSTEAGAWLKFVDMVESEKDGRIRVEKQAEDGPCGRECKTVGMACEQLLEEGWENELSEGLFGGEAADELASTACKEWSSACRKAAPKADKARKPGPPFRPFTEDERALEAYRAGAPPAPGVFQDETLAYALGVAGGTAGGSGGGGFGGGGMLDEYPYGGSLEGEKPRHDDLARMEAFVDVDEA